MEIGKKPRRKINIKNNIFTQGTKLAFDKKKKNLQGHHTTAKLPQMLTHKKSKRGVLASATVNPEFSVQKDNNQAPVGNAAVNWPYFRGDECPKIQNPPRCNA